MSKKKITHPERSMEELIARAVEAAKAPFTPSRKADLPSLRSVAEELGTTVIRTRKLLITADYFTSPTATSVQRIGHTFLRCPACGETYPITKSISRFARNTLDCLKYVDDLKQIGVNVFFEKENIRTDDPTSNFQLALLGAISQDESNSIGLNRRWAYQQRFANGDYNIGSNRILGYDGVDGKLVPNQDAWIIREIFERYVAGESYSGICRALAEKGAKTLRGGKFTVEAVRYILSNETYVGDKHLMKQPPTDYLTHQPMKRSDYKDYYLTDDHEGIVSRELWDRAQAIKKGFKDNLKNGVMGAGEHHFLYGKVFCGECGAPFVRRTLKTKGGVYYKAWNCRERQKGQKGNGCRCGLISEESLIDEIVKALGWETMDEGRFNREVSRVLVSDDDVQVEC